MPRAPAAAKPRKRAPAKAAAKETGGEKAVVKVAVPADPAPVQPDGPAQPRAEEPVWLVRAVLLLFLVGFAAFLAREVYNFVQALG